MWAQSWINLASLVVPYPDVESIDVTSALVDQDYSVDDMFNKADEFYVLLGLDSASESFGNEAMIERPTDGRDVVCHASAWDFYDQETFRYKNYWFI